MAKKIFQDEILFDEEKLTTPETQETPSTDAPTLVDDEVNLCLLHTLEQIVTTFTTMKGDINDSDELISKLREDMQLLSSEQKEFVEYVVKNYKFHFGMSNESLQKVREVIASELEVVKTGIHATTDAELKRLKHAYGDEGNNIDVLRLRWWPHGYILIIIIEIFFCSNLFLLMKVLGF